MKHLNNPLLWLCIFEAIAIYFLGLDRREHLAIISAYDNPTPEQRYKTIVGYFEVGGELQRKRVAEFCPKYIYDYEVKKCR